MTFRFSCRLAAALLVIAMAGCLADPMQLQTDPIPSPTAAVVRPAFGEEFQLRPGEVASFENGILLIGFRGVRNDSRCPSDATCVWQGDAELVIGTAPTGGPWKWSVLHTGIEPMSMRAEDLVVTVTGLDPVPTSGSAIPHESYRASLRVTHASTDAARG